MRVAITVDPYLPVPPKLYGGIERVVDFLVRGLVERGHDVTLFAHHESTVPVPLVPYGMPPHEGLRARLTERWQLGSALWTRRKEYDVVHSFGRLASLLPLLPLRHLPKIQSYQRDFIPWTSVRTAVRLAGPSISFTVCSGNMLRGCPSSDGSVGSWQVVFNGVDTAKYTASAAVAPDAPLVFLGRLDRIKGAHTAIAVARASGRRLLIAGNRVSSESDKAYFDQEITPHLIAGEIEYVGPVDDRQKNDLLGCAAALLMPVEWEEPFGITMVEALACGTPVIGLARGSVPEVVRHGVSGFVCRDPAEMVASVARLGEIDRACCRAEAERRFGDDVIVDQYERLYRQAAAR